jgi:hypothetical protein
MFYKPRFVRLTIDTFSSLAGQADGFFIKKFLMLPSEPLMRPVADLGFGQLTLVLVDLTAKKSNPDLDNVRRSSSQFA